LSADELLIAVEVPIPVKGSAHFFHEFARRHGDYAIAGLAALASRAASSRTFGWLSSRSPTGRFWSKQQIG